MSSMRSLVDNGEVLVCIDDVIAWLAEEALIAHKMKCPISAKVVESLRDVLIEYREAKLMGPK
jgi:hypothetical protein